MSLESLLVTDLSSDQHSEIIHINVLNEHISTNIVGTDLDPCSKCNGLTLEEKSKLVFGPPRRRRSQTPIASRKSLDEPTHETEKVCHHFAISPLCAFVLLFICQCVFPL